MTKTEKAKSMLEMDKEMLKRLKFGLYPLPIPSQN